jgi:HK97 family phage major capsid protein
MPDGGDVPTETELKALAVDLKGATDEVKKFAETYEKEMKNLGHATTETKANADKALTAMNEISARLTEIEQKMSRRPGSDGPPELKSLGQHVLDDTTVQALMERKSGMVRVTVELKDLYSGPAVWGPGTSVTNSLVLPDRQGLLMPPMRQLVVRDLLMPGSTISNAIEYPIETSDPAVTGASVVSEGALKPKTDVAFDLKGVPVRTIAHRTKASRQILDDAPQLRSYVDGRLRYGLKYVEETELLFGDGTGQHLLGIIPQATPYSAAFAPANAQIIDTLRLAALQATLALYPASGFVLNPIDWAKIELTKDGQQRYLVGDPQSQIAKRLWTLPVVDTPAMTAGHFLSGAFSMGAQIFDRMAVEVMISTEDEDNFSRNMITIRCEERLALAVYRPQAFIYGPLP